MTDATAMDLDPQPRAAAPGLYPIALDLRGQPVLVVGLGPVGRRRAAGLLAAGAVVRAVDPDPTLTDVPGAILWLREPFRPEHLQGVRLAIAAATPEVNAAVVLAARTAGVWVNSASDPGAGDVVVPAVERVGPIVLGVTTTGAGPGLARWIARQAGAALGPEVVALAELLGALRPIVRQRLADPETRHRLLQDWADPAWLDRIAREGPAAVRAALLADLERRAGGADPAQ